MDEATKEALDIVKAQAGVRNMTEDEIASMTQRLANQFRGIGGEAVQESEAKAQEPACDPKKAIREKSVVCLECGSSFKILSKKHLAQHGLTPEEYKEKWGFKKGQSLTAKSLSRERKKKMQEMQLWKRKKNYGGEPQESDEDNPGGDPQAGQSTKGQNKCQSCGAFVKAGESLCKKCRGGSE